MPTISGNFCGSMGGVISSKRGGIFGYTEPTCSAVQVSIQMDWVGNGYQSNGGSPSMSLSPAGFNNLGTPLWQFNGSWCGGQGSTVYSSFCPPDPHLTGFLTPLGCCAISGSAFMDLAAGAAGGVPINVVCTDCTSNGGTSSSPIRYATGELRISATDVVSNGYGKPWGHRRSFTSRQTSNETVGNGFCWKVQEWPYLIIQQSSTPGTAGNVTTVFVQGSADSIPCFDATSTGFAARFGLQATLVLDKVHETYRLTYPDGTVVVFDSGNGAFEQQINPGGDTISVTSYLADGFTIAQVQRVYTTGGNTTTEQLSYTYSSSSGDELLSTVTLARSVNGGALTNVLQANYTYYGPTDANGGEEDLKIVTTQVWTGSSLGHHRNDILPLLPVVLVVRQFVKL